jgi:hypothetical protein
LPDLDQAKSAVLNSLSSRDAQRGYRHAMDEFIEWYCSEPRLSQAPMTLATGIPLTYAQIAYPNFNASHFPVVAVPGTPGAARLPDQPQTGAADDAGRQFAVRAAKRSNFRGAKEPHSNL